MVGRGMGIGELARAMGMAPSALRYYESSGLLPAATRSQAGYRRYGPEAIGRLRFVVRAKALGLTIAQIRALIEAPHADIQAERDSVRHLVAHKLADTRAQMGRLRELSQELEALYIRLLREPTPDCGHVGDCDCWLPDGREVRIMTKEVSSTAGCTCAECTEPGCECDCSCCSSPEPAAG